MQRDHASALSNEQRMWIYDPHNAYVISLIGTLLYSTRDSEDETMELKAGTNEREKEITELIHTHIHIVFFQNAQTCSHA